MQFVTNNFKIHLFFIFSILITIYSLWIIHAQKKSKNKTKYLLNLMYFEKIAKKHKKKLKHKIK